MGKVLIQIALILFVVFGAIYPASGDTLKDLIAHASKTHPLVLAADAEMDRATADQRAAELAWTPRPTVSMGFSGVPLTEGDPFQSRTHSTLLGPYAHLKVEGAFVL